MAYFSNGCEGDWYEEKFCRRCVHGADGQACPVLVLHFEWNYVACNGDKPDASQAQRAKYKALNTLWPRDGIHNGQCAMFVEAKEPERTGKP